MTKTEIKLTNIYWHFEEENNRQNTQIYPLPTVDVDADSRTGSQSWDQSHIEPGYIFGSVQSKAAMSITDQSDTIILSSSNISVCKKV